MAPVDYQTIHFPTHHQHHHPKKTGEYYRVLILRTIGNFLILSSLFLIGKTFYQPVREEVKYVLNNYMSRQYVVASTQEAQQVQQQVKKGGLAQLFNLNQVEVLTPVDAQFSIVIPKIGANSRVIANVDPGDEKVYKAALKEGVAHTLGTAFPGEGGHIFLFAHSADNIFDVGTYNAVFYLLYKLEPGDQVDIFYKNQRYIYNVIDKKVVDPTDVEYLTRKSDSEFLTMQTCWPPGTTLKRLLVFAVPAE